MTPSVYSSFIKSANIVYITILSKFTVSMNLQSLGNMRETKKVTKLINWYQLGIGNRIYTKVGL